MFPYKMAFDHKTVYIGMHKKCVYHHKINIWLVEEKMIFFSINVHPPQKKYSSR